jgi:hypothetical protein
VLNFTDAYKIFDVNGAVDQQNISGGAKAARLLLGGNVKSIQSLKLGHQGYERRDTGYGAEGI